MLGLGLVVVEDPQRGHVASARIRLSGEEKCPNGPAVPKVAGEARGSASVFLQAKPGCLDPSDARAISESRLIHQPWTDGASARAGSSSLQARSRMHHHQGEARSRGPKQHTQTTDTVPKAASVSRGGAGLAIASSWSSQRKVTVHRSMGKASSGSVPISISVCDRLGCTVQAAHQTMRVQLSTLVWTASQRCLNSLLQQRVFVTTSLAALAGPFLSESRSRHGRSLCIKRRYKSIWCPMLSPRPSASVCRRE